MLTILNPRGMATRHQVSGDRYLDIRNRARIFSNVEVSVSKAREDRLVRSLKRLSGALSSVRQDAPQIPNRAYEQALTALEVERRGEYAVDKRRGGS